LKRTRDSAEPQQQVLANLFRHLPTRDLVRYGEPTTPDRLITQFEMIASTQSLGNGMLSISPLRNSTFSTPALR
jgi:hypothetical protein